MEGCVKAVPHEGLALLHRPGCDSEAACIALRKCVGGRRPRKALRRADILLNDKTSETMLSRALLRR